MDEDRSMLKFGVSNVLEEKYYFEYQERVTLNVRDTPHWEGVPFLL
ncbi:hypothetical protein [Natrinema sp. DC36]|nr:hypothetical protein [Natrinema sp. DC36]